MDTVPVLKLKERIKVGREKLADVSRQLKEHFVGIDDIIDQVLSNMEAWYLIPEVVTRPVIINLWGMTGVGKTDLVRKIAALLGFSDAYFEMQLCHSDNEYIGKSIATALSRSNIDQGRPGIVLLDEVQRFRAVDERGSEMQNMKYQDIWILLSDGRFASSARKSEMLELVLGDIYSAETYGADKEGRKKKKKTYYTSFYQAQSLKETLNLPDSIEEIMRWDSAKRMAVAAARINDKDAFAQEDYSKLLIFISGNIDEAYAMSGEVANGDVDADIFHAQSRCINIVDIKNALSKRFKPEHISRFGNTHIIYPSLSRGSYEEIIRRHTERFLADVNARHGISLTLGPGVFDFLYRNGVFPTQGVRPVFTTISGYLENSMPKIMMKAIDEGAWKLHADHASDVLTVRKENGTVLLTISWVGAMDRIRDSRNEDLKVVVSVHEAGHAIMYPFLFGYIPSQILSSATGFGGVTYVNSNTFMSRATVMDKLCMCYAGMAAEEIVFGKQMQTLGCEGDIETATDLVVQALKESGMFGKSSLIKSAECAARNGSRVNINDDFELNSIIEDVCSKQRKKSKAILAERPKLIVDVADVMIAEGQIKPVRLQEVLRGHGIEAELISTGEMVIADYTSAYSKFKGKAQDKRPTPKFSPCGMRMKKGVNVNVKKAEPDDEY